MTSQIIQLANLNKENNAYFNVKFRLGVIENLSVIDDLVDARKG